MNDDGHPADRMSLEELRDVVRKLDVTMDGVLIEPDMTVYVPCGSKSEARTVSMCVETLDWELPWIEYGEYDVFSTPEAAEKSAASA